MRSDGATPDGPPSGTAIARREALRRVAALLGGAVSAPAVLGVLAGCDARPTRGTGGVGADAAPRVLIGDRGEQVAAIAEHILPATDTPGARDAGVPAFVDVMLAEYYPADERARFLAGLAAVDARAGREHGRPFLRCAPAEQFALLARLDRQTFAKPRPKTPNPDERTLPGAGETPLPPEVEADTVAGARFGDEAVQFFRTMKELTLLGYYTSQAGATRELHYAKVPGRYDGCVPLRGASGATVD